jgi:hypothetical protein
LTKEFRENFFCKILFPKQATGLLIWSLGIIEKECTRKKRQNDGVAIFYVFDNLMEPK